MRRQEISTSYGRGNEIEQVLQVMDQPTAPDDILLLDRYEILSANLHTYDGAARWIKKYYPEYSEVKYKTIPVTFKEAKAFISKHHRHHIAPQGYKFAIAISDGSNIVGIAIAGRPVSRLRDDGSTIEVTRLCVKNGYKNVCSILYSQVAVVAKTMGYKKVITYTLESESGKSLLAAGFKYNGTNKGGSWNTKRRPRADKAPTIPKKIWEMKLAV